MDFLPRLRRLAGVPGASRRGEPEILFQMLEERFLDLPDAVARDVVTALEILDAHPGGLTLARWSAILAARGVAGPDAIIETACKAGANLLRSLPGGVKMTQRLFAKKDEIMADGEEFGDLLAHGMIVTGMLHVARGMERFTVRTLAAAIRNETEFPLAMAIAGAVNIIRAFPDSIETLPDGTMRFRPEPVQTRADVMAQLRKVAAIHK